MRALRTGSLAMKKEQRAPLVSATERV
jgi:hypothetical protein